MKKVLLTIIALLVLCANQVQASNLNKYSNDIKVIEALNVLSSIGSNDVFTNLEKTGSKIMFYDLSLMDFSYAKHFAVASTDENGDNYILINEKFRNSPKEALAALIAHESVHVLPQATLEEEIAATTKEAETWLKVGATATTNTNDELVKRQNKLAIMYSASTPNNNLIRESIANNSFYKQQLAMK